MGLQRTGERFRRCRYVDDDCSLEIEAGKIVDPLLRDIQTISGKDEGSFQARCGIDAHADVRILSQPQRFGAAISNQLETLIGLQRFGVF